MHIGLNAQLLNSGDSYRSAGVSNYSLHLLHALGALALSDASTHNFTAWVNDPAVTIDGVDLVRSDLPLHRPVARILWEQTVLPRTLQARDFDLVHGLVNVLPLATQVPGVVTVHDLSFIRLPETLPRAKRAYLRRLCAASVARARRVIAVSRQTADDVMHAFGVDANHIAVIPNGIDSIFSPGTVGAQAAFRKQHGLAERFILYLGTLEPRKNLPLLLRAYASWRAQTATPMPLILAGGKGWFYDEIFQLTQELGIAGHVRFPGYIPQTELVDWYRAATLFVYPSRFEGFGLPVLEAMACGTPVLCSDAPSLLEAAGDAALTFPREEARGVPVLAAQLEQTLSDSALRHKLRLRGLKQARRFTWAQTARATVAVYDEVGGL